jgi:hypothetical protein
MNVSLKHTHLNTKTKIDILPYLLMYNVVSIIHYENRSPLHPRTQ